MKKLAEFQAELLAFTFQNNQAPAPGITPGMTPKPLTEPLAALLAQCLPHNALTPEKQLDIYQSSIQNSLINALGQIYPICQQLTGERFFHQMALQFVLYHPSTQADLAEYGEAFSVMIKTYEPARNVPCLADMARLEWAYHRAFHASNQTPLNLQCLQGYSSDELVQCIFSLPQSHCLLQTDYPVDKIWQAHQTQDTDVLHATQKQRYLYIYRNHYSIHIDRLTQQQWQFLTLIKQSLSFEQVCAQLDDTSDVTELLVHSLHNSWLEGLTC